MSNIVNNISHTLAIDMDHTGFSDSTRAMHLEDTLTEVCYRLAEANALTKDFKVDIEYLLSIVASYLLGIQEGTVDPDLTEPPSLLFKESLYPSLKVKETIDTEVIEYDDFDDSGASSADGSDSTPDLRA